MPPSTRGKGVVFFLGEGGTKSCGCLMVLWVRSRVLLHAREAPAVGGHRMRSHQFVSCVVGFVGRIKLEAYC